MLSAPALTACAAALACGALAGRVLDHHAVRAPRREAVPAGDPGIAPVLPARALGAPLPELLGALIAVLVVLRLGASADLPAWLWFGALGLLLALVDLREQLLPDRVLLPGTAVGLLLLTAAATADGAWPALVRALAAGALSFAVLLGPFALVAAALAPLGACGPGTACCAPWTPSATTPRRPSPRSSPAW